MFPTLLVCAAILSTDAESPASAIDAIEQSAVAQLTEYFVEPDAEAAALFAMPVATVNGQTILAGAVLSRYSGYLQQVRVRISPEEYAQAVQDIIQRDLPSHIIAQTIWSEVKGHSTTETQNDIRRQLERMWNSELLRLAQELKGNELTFPTSLAVLHEQFIRQGLIQSFLTAKFVNLPSEEFREYQSQLLQDAQIETAYTVSFDEYK